MGMNNYDSFIRFVLRPETSWALLGLKGCGKTNTACVLMQEAVERGFHVYTNIHFFDIEQVPLAISREKLPKRWDGKSYKKKPDEIHVSSRLSDLLIGLCNPGKKVVVLDEAGIHADSSSAVSKSTRNIKDISKIIRHFDSSFGLITQVKASIPPDLRERTLDLELNIEQRGRDRFLHAGKRSAKRDDETGEMFIVFPKVDSFGPIPLTTLPFDGKFPSGFDIDIDMKVALNALSSERSTMDIVEGGRGKIIIENLMKPKKKGRPKKTG